MKPDFKKIKNATTKELIEQYELVEEEIQRDNMMYSISYARYKELDEYKTAIYIELKER